MSSSIRTRRDAEDPMKTFKAWMTEEQQKKITDMKVCLIDRRIEE